ncbi:synphilin-1 [Periophthalmus magnuspinnatus]|uniref:synphilin-1 n=1 Tax=Periophthalmus magnuspinnatus TaxID=409849 RepID=UPI00145AECD9|nr:synphilin-1 [Periophthalmus magnuspinnatus]
MEAPEYLDLDEIDFSDDSVYSVSSLKNIPELSRRSDGAEDRAAPSVPWSRGVSAHALSEVHSKFRPVKRVSPLKHQPETDASADTSGAEPEDAKATTATEGAKNEPEKPPCAQTTGSNATAPHATHPPVEHKHKPAGAPHSLFGELEHYDLDMDEILDVPYIKSSPMSTTLPRATQEKRSTAGNSVSAAGTLERNQRGTKASALPHNETLSLGSSSAQTPFCVLSPVKWSDLRKCRSIDPDLHHLQRSGASAGAFTPTEVHCSGLLSCSSSLSSFSDTGCHSEKLLSARVFPDVQRAGGEAGGSGLMFAQGGCTMARQDQTKPWTPGGPAPEMDEETKRNQNILNIVREGQISLLPHLAADNLEQIRDDQNNNLLHLSASQGHSECLQHLTSLMGEDGLNERNQDQLTPAGLAVKNGHLECVRWMVSETEAIAELSCTREFPSLIHYAAQYGQEKVLLWLLQFMQEQAISLDEADLHGNTAVHTAAQHGHLTCIQTLVEYGSNVTVLNQQGERASQCAERHGHTSCARYLVVVETCMSLASQVVKLTKQLSEQASERMSLQKQLQRLMDPNKTESSPCRSPGSHHASGDAWPELLLTAEVNPGDGAWTVRQLQSRDSSEAPCPRDRLPTAGTVSRDAPLPPGAPGAPGAPRRRELKLQRFKNLSHRTMSESDTEAVTDQNNGIYGHQSEEVKPGPGLRPSHLPLSPDDQSVPDHLHLMMKKHLPHSSSISSSLSSSSDQRKAFSIRESKSVDNYCSYTLQDHPPEPRPPDPTNEDPNKVATSPKSALKSPSSRRKTAPNLKLRVTFDEQMIHKNNSTAPSQQEAEPSRVQQKRSFGTFRSIMGTLSGNANHSNNNGNSGTAANQSAAGRKGASPGGGAKGKSRSSNV